MAERGHDGQQPLERFQRIVIVTARALVRLRRMIIFFRQDLPAVHFALTFGDNSIHAIRISCIMENFAMYPAQLS
jgi:hypothetical protein